MNWLRIWLIHTKIAWGLDKDYDQNGGGILPCYKCGRNFKSYIHLSSEFGYIYDSLCEDCVKQMEGTK